MTDDPRQAPEARDSTGGEPFPVVVSPAPPTPFALFGIGGANAACWLTGFGLGWLVDSRLGTTPLFLILGLLLGVVAGVMSTYQEVRRYLRQ